MSLAREGNIHLFLFMTEGMSLAKWRDIGMLGREMALYVRLQPHLAGVTIVSYGDREEEEVVSDFPGIGVICNRWKLPQSLYRRFLPRMLRNAHHGEPIYKSNQTAGADLALSMARKACVPFLARCGYMLAETRARQQGEGSAAHKQAEALEHMVFNAAAHCVVTTRSMKERVVAYGVPEARVSVIPNYVDTTLFRPFGVEGDEKKRIVFIGRLSEEKNLLLLLEALQGLDVVLDVVGGGGLREMVASEARRRNVIVEFHGNLPHDRLPQIINAGHVFVLPSRYEGHPKTLIEAMACGAAVIGTDVPGIREVIDDGRTGLLCTPTAAALRAAIERLLAKAALRRFLGDNARHQIEATLSLDRVVELECAAYRASLAQPNEETQFGT